jgi:DNA-binding transcriptional MerR regulator
MTLDNVTVLSIIWVMTDAARYGIEELAALGGVTRRTVRYYVQENLIPTPLGVGRGRHYGPRHLAQLQAVKALQERGLSLEDVRRELERGAGRGRPARAASPPEPPVARTAWTRLEIVPGVEIHVSGQRRLPPPGRLRELAEWCERHFRGNDGE